jgi:uncharacterized protein (DUF1697 family)
MTQHKYVALLRGINVGTAKRVSMEELRGLVADLGFTDVHTLLNSGNVVFAGRKRKPEGIAAEIEQALLDATGVSSKTLVLAEDHLNAIVGENSLTSVSDNHSKLLVAMYYDPADREKVEPLLDDDWTPEALAVGSRAAYIWCANGILESRLVHTIGKLLVDRSTTRNWATLSKIAALIGE